MNKKVEIIIEKKKDYTFVGFQGAECPCYNNNEIEKAIKNARNWIINGGASPVITDHRGNLNRWLN